MSLLLAAGLLAGFAAPQRETVDVSAIIARLGTSASVSGDYDVLDRHRCIALPLIVEALVKLPAVSPGKVGGDLGRPENWLTHRTSDLLRTLRILTDHDEFGPISRSEYARLPVYREKPGGGTILKRDSLIQGLPAGRSRYSGYWLSHGTSFYAPIRTQRLIRKQWKIFVANFQCHSNLSKRRWDPSFFNG